MDVAKEVLAGIVDQLQPSDSLSIVLFRWAGLDAVQLGRPAGWSAGLTLHICHVQKDWSVSMVPCGHAPSDLCCPLFLLTAATARVCPRRWAP